jgi:lipoate-protein ligase A
MKSNDILLARRPIGGGAVYQDLGDTCWAFVEPVAQPKANADIIVSALRYLGLKALGTTYGVVEIADRQIARSLVLRIGDQVVQHGILRVNPNRTMLTKSLSRQTRADLPTLCDLKPILNHDMICEALVHAFQENSDRCSVRYINADAMMNEGKTKHAYTQLSSVQWIYGKTPAGKTCVSRDFDFGTFDVALKVEGAKVKGALVHSDCMLTDVVEKFEDCINRFTSSVLPQRYLGRKYVESLKTPEEKEMAEALLTWIVPEMKKLKVM